MMENEDAIDSLLAVERYLTQLRHRDPESSQDTLVRENLKQIKKDAIARDDQKQAEQVWCYETILRIQNQYIFAFQLMKDLYFYYAWCTLERVEINLGFLGRHFDLGAAGTDKFSLCFIKKHTEQFQSLFPYQLFMSPGFVALEKVCTICGKPISLRQPCGHVAGEIYNGEMCARGITKVEFIEISTVTSPVQKYSVMFLGTGNTEGGVDHHNYWHVDYVVHGLYHAFAAWDMVWTTKRQPISEFGDVGRNDLCPCGSGKKFKKCCIKKDAIESRHLTIHFSEEPPPDLPSYEEHGFVRGRGTLIRPMERENFIDRLNALEAMEEE